MSTAPDDFTAKLIDEYRANGGKVGGMFGGMQLLLLHHVGAKSGQERVTPLAYLEDDGHYVIFASKAGAPTNPGWYHNLKAHPNVSIEVGDQQYDVVATEASRRRARPAVQRPGRTGPGVWRVPEQDRRPGDPGDRARSGRGLAVKVRAP